MSKLYKIAASREGAAILRKRPNETTAKQLGRVLKLYKDWANRLVPALEFGDVLERTEKLGGTKRVRVRRARARLRARARGGEGRAPRAPTHPPSAG
jgi:hypothetical protein